MFGERHIKQTKKIPHAWRDFCLCVLTKEKQKRQKNNCAIPAEEENNGK